MSIQSRMSFFRFATSKALFIVCAILGIAGCTTSAVIHSEKHVAYATKANAIDVYYIERNMISTYPANQVDASPVNRTIAKFGYFELGPKLLEFGPAMFRLNGLKGNFQQLPTADLTPSTISKLGEATGSLVLEFRQGRIVKRGAVETLTMMLNATLYDPSGRSRIWSAQFSSHLGDDPAFGVLKTTRVDQAYVEGLLAMVLDQMSKEQLLALPDGKPLQPSAQKP